MGKKKEEEEEKKKKLARHEKFEETVFNEQRIFQLTSGQQVHAKLARARARCKRQAQNAIKKRRRFRAWNNHDCLWPSSMWPVSLARSWSHGERYRLHGRTPSGLSSAPFFLQKKTAQLASSDSRHDHERYRGIESDISFNFSFFIHISKHLERHSCMEKEISFVRAPFRYDLCKI